MFLRVIRRTAARIATAAALLIPASAPAQTSQPTATRTIEIDVRSAGAPLDRSFDLSVGADYPGTLIR